MERITRIELATTAWEAVVLPLNYIRIYNSIIILFCGNVNRFVSILQRVHQSFETSDVQ